MIAPGRMVIINTTILILQHLTVRDGDEFPCSANVGIGMFLLSIPIFDHDFMLKNHWIMLTALPDPNINKLGHIMKGMSGGVEGTITVFFIIKEDFPMP